MSNTEWDNEDDDFDFESQDKASVEQERFRDLRKAKRADEKRIKELTEKLETLTKAQSEQVIRSVLDQKGVNSKAARLILKDLEDVNEESVNKWLSENGDLFGFNPTDDTPAISNADRQALTSQDALTQGALSPDRMQDLEYKIENAQSMEELQRIMYSENNS